jgi:hypothetical protein
MAFASCPGEVQPGWRANMETHYMDRRNLGLLRSLSVIHDAKTQYNSIKASASTPTILLSKIKLCDVLLQEIRAIHSNLAELASEETLPVDLALVRGAQCAM